MNQKPLVTNITENVIEIQTFSLNKMDLKCRLQKASHLVSVNALSCYQLVQRNEINKVSLIFVTIGSGIGLSPVLDHREQRVMKF